MSIDRLRTVISAIEYQLNVLKENLNERDEETKQSIDEAYQKGLNDGKEYGLDEADMREAVSYQKGLDDAWEAVKSLFRTFGTESACVIMKNDNVHGAIDRLKAYEEKQKAEDNIKVGDEVAYAEDTYVVTYIYGENCDGINLQMGMCREGIMLMSAKKTGRHFDIEKILDEMNRED